MMLFVPDHLWTQEMYNEVMLTMPNTFHSIPDHFKTQGMCIKAVEVDSSFLQLVPDHFKMQEICDKARKKRQKNYGHKYGSFLCLVARYKICLAAKEVYMKMSSVMPFSFNAVELCVVTINE